MKKQLIIAAMSALAWSAEPAYAACTGTALTQTELLAILPNHTVCGRPGSSYPGGENSPDRWQEQHVGSNAKGDLVDYKKGPADPIDPSKSVGTYAIVSGQVNHNYGAGASFTYSVFQSSTVYSFCEGTSERARATVKSGLTSCSSGDYPP